MIVTCLSKRVTVYQDYKPHIDFNIDFEQFTGVLDIVTFAAQNKNLIPEEMRFLFHSLKSWWR